MRGMTVRQLADLLEGQLQFGSMPPLAGECEVVGRIVCRLGEVRVADVYVAPGSEGNSHCGCLEEAFVRGALGVVAQRRVCPWPGRFVIRVPDTAAAMQSIRNWEQHQPGAVASVVHVNSDAPPATAGDVLQRH